MYLRSILLALVAMMLCSSAQAAKQEIPELPISDRLKVNVVRVSPDLVATSSDLRGVFNVLGLYGVGEAAHSAGVDRANANAAQTREKLAGFDFNAALETRLREGIARAGLSAQPDIEVFPKARGLEAEKAVGDTLLVYPTFAFGQGGKSIDLTLNMHYQTGEQRSPGGRVSVRKRFIRSYHFHLVADPSAGNPIAFWNAMPAARLQGLVDGASAQVVEMLVQDFTPEARATWLTNPPDDRAAFMGKTFHGHVIRREGDVAWIQAGSGWGRVTVGFRTVRQ